MVSGGKSWTEGAATRERGLFRFFKGCSEGSGRGSLPRRGFALDGEARDDGESNGRKFARSFNLI